MTLDPACAESYRPITLSVVISKILEQYILDQSNSTCDDAQFGFDSGKSSAMAAAVAHDIGIYCLERGSPLYYCNLDAESAFDALPHNVILLKTMDVIPDRLWLILHYWYQYMNVRIRIGNLFSEKIAIQRGTRQGGLTSPFIFKSFYKGLIERLQKCRHGITLDNNHFNCLCYADDVLLCCTTVTGLQELITIANNYVNQYALRFNPSKTSCLILGKNPFTVTPKWKKESVSLNVVPTITYLGTVLGDMNGYGHCQSRIRSATKAFCSLQGAGIKFPGVSLDVSLEMYRTAVHSVITFGCASVYLSKQSLNNLEKWQSKIVKQIVVYPLTADGHP